MNWPLLILAGQGSSVEAEKETVRMAPANVAQKNPDGSDLRDRMGDFASCRIDSVAMEGCMVHAANESVRTGENHAWAFVSHRRAPSRHMLRPCEKWKTVPIEGRRTLHAHQHRMVRQSTVISAPGKVLLAGGYLVLEPAYPGLVLSTTARFYSVVQSGEIGVKGRTNASLPSIRVHSPQFINATWEYLLDIHEDRCAVYQTRCVL